MEPMEQDNHFIPDGMNDFERSVKRIGDFIRESHYNGRACVGSGER